MDYSKANKEAWEEAFAAHKKGYKEDLAERLKRGERGFFNEDMHRALAEIGFVDKNVAQFCCNNGRELLALVKYGAASGTGFDIAENFIQEGRRLARETELNAEFVAANIYDIDEEYAERFDILLITIGVLSWFDDLDKFFAKVALVLKKGGTLIINEQHPFTNMMATNAEEEFEPERPDKVAFSYFKQDPWIESDGIDYIGGTTYKSKPLYSFSQSFSMVLNALHQSGLTFDRLSEYEYDISTSFPHLDGKGMPLSYILTATKPDRTK